MKQYKYQIVSGKLLPILIPLSLVGCYFIFKALNNRKGLIINNMIELSPNTATYFWWFWALFTMTFVLLGLSGLLKSFISPNFVTLDNNQITAPKSPLSSKLVSIKYSDITECKIQEISGVRSVTIHSPCEKLNLAAPNFEHKTDFDEIVAILFQKMQRSQ